MTATQTPVGATPAMVAQLNRPTPAERVQWRGDRVTRDGTRIAVLAYVDARYVMETLDEVVLPENWQDRYEDAAGGGVRCGLGINVSGEWVWKWDAAPATDIEGVKGAHSDSLKRAAVKWGIGRDLYEYPDLWCPAEETFHGSGKYRPASLPHWNGSEWAVNGHSTNGRGGGPSTPPPAPSHPRPVTPSPVGGAPEEPPELAEMFDHRTDAQRDAVVSQDGFCPTHGTAWVLKPGGVSKTSGKPYDPFWACASTERPFCKEKPSKAFMAAHEG